MKTSKTTAPVVKLLGVNELPDPFVDESDASTTYYGYAPRAAGKRKAVARLSVHRNARHR